VLAAWTSFVQLLHPVPPWKRQRRAWCVDSSILRKCVRLKPCGITWWVVPSWRYSNASLCSSKELALLNGWRQESLHYLPYVCWAETSVLCCPGSKACEGDATLWKIKYWFQRSASKHRPETNTDCNRRVFKISVCLCMSWHAINHGD